MTAPMSTRVAEKVSGVLSSRFSRRGFFARSAIVGSAVAVGPVGFALKPTTAYAAVCNCQGSACQCGSLCCDGYTEFCCTLTGSNKCPPGTLMGGWWKADGSGMCSGARYYMDCNAPCNGCGCGANGVCGGDCSGTGCGCANGDCNNRKAGCTQFRYGQCNQSIPCIGPILCRVVTCLAPWDIDPSCTTAIRVDQATVSHDRPCLHRTIGSLDSAGEENGRIRLKGWALDYDTQGPVRIDVYSDNQFIGSGTADTRRDDVGAQNPGHGNFHGFDFLIDGKGGSHDICVYAINAAGPGDNALLGCRKVLLSNPVGAIDTITAGLGKMQVSGWALDPNTTGPIKVHVYANNVFKGEFTANTSRPDIGGVYPGFGNNHGYSAEFDIQTGTKNVCVYAINVGAGNANTVLGCRTYVVGGAYGSFDMATPRPGSIRVEGWAIDPDVTGPVTVRVLVDGQKVGEGLADKARPDVGAAHPGYGNAHGFSIDVPASAGSRQVCVTLVDDSGKNPNPSIGCKTVQVRGGNPTGALDAVTAGPGTVRVAGWALDPDTADPVEIHVWAGGQFLGSAVADKTRNDIASAFPGYGANHGFQATFPLAAGFSEVTVYAINVGSGNANVVVGKKNVFIGGAPFGSFDTLSGSGGSITVGGWAIDPDTADPIDVHVYVDEVYKGSAVADSTRADIGAAFPGYGAQHGFSKSFAVGAGSHKVCVYAINKSGAGDNPVLGCKTVVV